MNGFINYDLTKDIEKAIEAGVIQGEYSRFNERSISELERLIGAMDEIDAYVVIKSIIKHHRTTLVNTLEYMEKEGET
jgi:hypothetical protein